KYSGFQRTQEKRFYFKSGQLSKIETDYDDKDRSTEVIEFAQNPCRPQFFYTTYRGKKKQRQYGYSYELCDQLTDFYKRENALVPPKDATECFAFDKLLYSTLHEAVTGYDHNLDGAILRGYSSYSDKLLNEKLE